LADNKTKEESLTENLLGNMVAYTSLTFS